MKCTQCQFPERKLWTYASHPDFETIETGNWVILEKCSHCGQLWCKVPYEPYSSFPFWTAWQYTEEEWKRLNEIDNAMILHEWHANVIREELERLTKEDLEAVDAWRDRTYKQFNPIDKNPEFKYCSSSEEIENYIQN